MKRLVLILGWALACCTLAAEIRDPNVIYFDEIGVPSPAVRATRQSGICTAPNLQSALWTLHKGQPVLLLGWSEQALYVEARTNVGVTRGWVDPGAMEQPAGKTLTDWKRRFAALQDRRALMAQKKIGVGFSREEVTTVFGKPDRVEVYVIGKVRQEDWTYYITAPQSFYEYYIDSFGRSVINRSYTQNVAVGSRTVILQNDKVVAYREDTPKIDRSPRPVFIGYQR